MKEYWDNQWRERIKAGHGVAMNREKMVRLVYELARRDGLDGLEKLDIGCGSGVHALILAGVDNGWKRKWTGIDLSESVNYCKKYGFNAIQGDFFTHEFDRKFECFLMLDSLEHFMDHKAVAKRIKELAAERFVVFVNVPLYCQGHAAEAGAERVVTSTDIKDFMEDLGIKKEKSFVEIYGSYGYPYMIAEGSNH